MEVGKPSLTDHGRVARDTLKIALLVLRCKCSSVPTIIAADDFVEG